MLSDFLLPYINQENPYPLPCSEVHSENTVGMPVRITRMHTADWTHLVQSIPDQGSKKLLPTAQDCEICDLTAAITHLESASCQQSTVCICRQLIKQLKLARQEGHRVFVRNM